MSLSRSAFLRRWAPVAFATGAFLTFAPSALAQTSPLLSEEIRRPFDTGYVQNLGLEPQAVAAFHVFEEGAPWLRLEFDQVELSGNRAAGTGSFLRITSLFDGHHQILDAVSIEQWRNATAYFNGDLLLVELVAYPGTGSSRVLLGTIEAGLLSLEDTICGGSDDRVPSNDARAARILPVGCTGFIIDDACGCMITAGHCSFGTSTIQFNVPASNGNGSLNHPSPDHQYALDSASMQSSGSGGVGNDWAYFGAHPNSNTGLTPFEAQGDAYTFDVPPTWQGGLNVRITGYGVDGGTRNQVQQTHVGPWLSWGGGNSLDYRADTQGGNSGSPVIQEESGIAMGVHTHGGCTSSGGSNHGTAAVHNGLRNALAAPKGVCFKVAPPTCAVAPATTFRNGTGANPVCLTSLTLPEVGTTWEVEVDASVVTGADFTALRGGQPGGPTPSSLGEMLINTSGPTYFSSVVSGGGRNVHRVPIPSHVELAGLSGAIQAVIGVGGQPQQLCNGEDFTVGCRQ